jgi:hypothetical protein
MDGCFGSVINQQHVSSEDRTAVIRNENFVPVIELCLRG